MQKPVLWCVEVNTTASRDQIMNDDRHWHICELDRSLQTNQDCLVRIAVCRSKYHLYEHGNPNWMIVAVALSLEDARKEKTNLQGEIYDRWEAEYSNECEDKK